MRDLGKFVVVIGVIITLLGLVMWSGFAPKWLGRLPGDIRIEREHSAFYFPIVTCIILSILLEFAVVDFPALGSIGFSKTMATNSPMAQSSGIMAESSRRKPRSTCRCNCCAAVVVPA